FKFVPEDGFRWSPKQQHISYKLAVLKQPRGAWALLHEVGHAILAHNNYKYDFELLLLEVAAWQAARSLAPTYNQKISDDHIQDGLDSYREWLHRRSTCPSCYNRSLQQNSGEYSCFNCHSVWKVSQSRFCRTYRQINFNDSELLTSRSQAFFV
ncbi:MAG: hypothetical protein ACREGF_03720, partial [Candidatus Saccharimonadales bacterium]